MHLFLRHPSRLAVAKSYLHTDEIIQMLLLAFMTYRSAECSLLLVDELIPDKCRSTG